MEAADILQGLGISVEVIDVQSLLPFDRHHHIVQSLQRTNRLIVMDEDVPGGATAFMLQQILEVQGGYRFLDSAPVTITSQAHRPAYADDGDYFSKSQVEDVLREATAIMAEVDPGKYKALYS
jgi:pyruvate/2-oxoglutarate/acetoin dehydrogenase E1 component